MSNLILGNFALEHPYYSTLPCRMSAFQIAGWHSLSLFPVSFSDSLPVWITMFGLDNWTSERPYEFLLRW